MNAQEHLMVVAAEEAGEVAVAALALGKSLNKTLRFGIDDTNPATNKTNAQMLDMELNDLIASVEMLLELGVELPGLYDREQIDKKKAKVQKYMGYAEQRGTLSEK